MRGYNYSTIKLFYLQIIILLITNCTSKKLKNFDQSPFTNSKWLETNEILPQLDSLYYLNDPSPLFRKEFITKDKIKRNIIKKTQYITNLPTFSQTRSVYLTYADINFGIIEYFFVVYKTNEKILQILIK